MNQVISESRTISTTVFPINMHLALAMEANAADHAFALWRLPGQAEVHLLVDMGGIPHRLKVSVEQDTQGFVVSPYANEGLEQSLLLHPDIYYRATTEPKLELGQRKEHHADAELLLAKAIKNTQNGANFRFHSTNSTSQTSGKQHFVDSVGKAVEAIKENHFKKVVLSRYKDVAMPDGYDPWLLFERLCQARPGAFVSFISVPGVGTWMGATPELLIKVEGRRHFTTVALAGTQQAAHIESMEDVAWRQKEIEEQAMVSRYIIDCFKKIRLREFEEIGPKTVKAANLIHLKTEFRVDMQAVNFEQLGSVMLDLLHPTSAVCGMPKLPATNFILQHEGYDRELYSGFLGPINFNDLTAIFVNLRCMQLHPTKARLYAGAGITEYSNPEKEWLETEYKCQTMLEVIDQFKGER